MKKNFKKIVALACVAVIVVVALVLSTTATFNTKAQAVQNGNGYYNPIFVINSASQTGTNSHFGTATNGYYPSFIGGGDIVTNFGSGPFDVTGTRVVTLQLTASSVASVGAVTGQQIVLTVYRSISGGSATNTTGGNLLYDTLGTVTLPVTASTSGPWTVLTNFTDYQTPVCGANKLYFGKLDCGAVTNGTSVTNYSVRMAFE